MSATILCEFYVRDDATGAVATTPCSAGELPSPPASGDLVTLDGARFFVSGREWVLSTGERVRCKVTVRALDETPRSRACPRRSNIGGCVLDAGHAGACEWTKVVPL